MDGFAFRMSFYVDGSGYAQTGNFAYGTFQQGQQVMDPSGAAGYGAFQTNMGQSNESQWQVQHNNAQLYQAKVIFRF